MKYNRMLALILEFIGDIMVVAQMFADWFCGRYRSFPWYCIAAVAFAILYALCPLNWIPVIGLLDDVAVLYLCLKLLAPEILRYKQWRQSTGGN